jgi:cytoplasmic iron level regulating protein YaaA (DUF328/UPF0246 family)
MLFLLSPAKTLDFENAALTEQYTEARLLSESEELISEARKLTAEDIKRLMNVSDNIAKLNQERFKDWALPFNLKNAKQAIFAFKGDVYTGLSVESVGTDQLDYLQSKVRILSGLYGLLRPLDLMQPYRLEMGIKFSNPEGPNLYQFWSSKITDLLNSDIAEETDEIVVNLASNEYFKSVKPKLLKGRLITPVFKDLKGDTYKIISFYAKKARGLMVRYAADHSITDPEQLKQFNYAGYAFCPSESNNDTWVFHRDNAPK